MKSQNTKKKARWYTRLPYYVASCRGLTAREKILLCIILDHIGKHDFGWPSVQTLAVKAGRIRQAVQRNIAGLKQRRYLIVESGGAGKSNHYRPGPALLELERSWWAERKPVGAIKKPARVLLRQGCSVALHRVQRGASPRCSVALHKHIQGERIPANADNQTKKREGKGRISLPPPDASASSARAIRHKQSSLPDKSAWVLDTIKQVLGKNFSAQGKNFKQDTKRLARWCREFADERGETKREVLKRLCREAQNAISNGSWKPPIFLSNLLKDAIWKSLDPETAPRAPRFARHDGGNGDGLDAMFPGYAGIIRRLSNRVQT